MKKEAMQIRSRKGVTLLELIVAMVIGSLILAMIFGFLIYGSRIFKRSDQQSQIQFDVRTASDHLVGELRNVTAISVDSVYSDSFDLNVLKARYPNLRSVNFEITEQGGLYLLNITIEGADNNGKLPYQLVTKLLLQNIDTYIQTGEGSVVYYKRSN